MGTKEWSKGASLCFAFRFFSRLWMGFKWLKVGLGASLGWALACLLVDW